MRRFLAIAVLVPLLACGGGGGDGDGAGTDSTAETCRKVDSLPRASDATPEAWARVEAIRKSAGPEVAALLVEVITAGKAGDYSNVIAPAARLQALCVAAGESLG